LRYLLDTNVCIQLLNNSNQKVSCRLAIEQPKNICLCTTVQMELYYGAYRSTQKERNLALLKCFFDQFTILPLDNESAMIAGEIRAQLAALGTPIGPYDLQIAAIALAKKLILVTHNTQEFKRVAGLQIEDWETAVE
jgi:tRNA(fMet)-specific endonuclease VapC